MNSKQLDGILRKLSDLELFYRDDKGEPQYLEDNMFSRDGNEYYRMNCQRDIMHMPFAFRFHPYVTISRHDRYAPVRPHVHDWIELSYMYSGSCSQIINDTVSITLKQGQMLLLDSGATHSIGNTGEEDILINILMDKAFFTETFFNHFTQENVLLKFLLNAVSEKAFHDNYILFHSENSARIALFMQEFMIEFLSPPSETSLDVADNLINLIFLELVNVYRTEAASSELKLGKSNLVAILKYIESNYRTCTLTDTAEFFNLNPNYLSTMLKKGIGYSFKELIQHHRFIYVTTMLRNTQIPIDEIIFQAGYENTTYFYKKFKEKYGCSPKKYRESRGGHKRCKMKYPFSHSGYSDPVWRCLTAMPGSFFML